MIAVAVAVALFALTPLLAQVGMPVEVVGLLSLLALLALAIAFVSLAQVASRRPRWSITLAVIALAAASAAALLLLVQEPQPAYLHPEWDWYWPLVNTLYFGGLLLGITAFISAALAIAMTRSSSGAVSLVVAIAALVVNRIAPYR